MTELISITNSLNFAKQILKAKANHINKIITAERFSTKREMINIGEGDFNTEVIYFFNDKSELRISNFDNYLFKYVASSGKPKNYVDTEAMKRKEKSE